MSKRLSNNKRKSFSLINDFKVTEHKRCSIRNGVFYLINGCKKLFCRKPVLNLDITISNKIISCSFYELYAGSNFVSSQLIYWNIFEVFYYSKIRRKGHSYHNSGASIFSFDFETITSNLDFYTSTTLTENMQIIKQNLEALCYARLEKALFDLGITQMYISKSQKSNQISFIIYSPIPGQTIVERFNDCGFDCTIETRNRKFSSDEHVISLENCSLISETEYKTRNVILKDFVCSDQFFILNLINDITRSARLSLAYMANNRTVGIVGYNYENGTFSHSAVISPTMAKALGIVLTDGFLSNRPGAKLLKQASVFDMCRNILINCGFDVQVQESIINPNYIDITITGNKNCNTRAKAMYDLLNTIEIEEYKTLYRDYLNLCEPFAFVENQNNTDGRSTEQTFDVRRSLHEQYANVRDPLHLSLTNSFAV